MERGIYLAITALVIWGILDATSRYAVVTLDANPFIFSCLNLIFGGLALLALGGKGWGNLETFKNPYTWVFGFFRVMMTIFVVCSFLFITASEEGFMIRISAVMAVVWLWVFCKKEPAKKELPGIALIVFGFLLLVLRQEDHFLNLGVIFVLLGALCDTILSITAEKHPISSRALDFRTRARYTGVILIVTSLFFTGVALIFAILSDKTSYLPLENATIAHWIPSLSDFTHIPTILAALFVGIFLRAPSMYCYLFAARLIKADMLLMVSTLATFSTLMAESVFSLFGLLDISALDFTDIFAGLLMTAGALFTVITRFFKHYREQQKLKHDPFIDPHA